MKQITLILATLFVAELAWDQEQEKQDKLQLSVGSQVLSQYVFKSGLVVHEEPVVQTDIFLSLPRGFYLDVWSSFGTNDADLSGDFADEVDYTVGWTGELGRQLALDLGVSYFDLVDLFNAGGDGDVLRPYAKLSRAFPVGKVHTLTPLFNFEWHQPLKDTMPAGSYTTLGLQHVWTPPGQKYRWPKNWACCTIAEPTWAKSCLSAMALGNSIGN